MNSVLGRLMRTPGIVADFIDEQYQHGQGHHQRRAAASESG